MPGSEPGTVPPAPTNYTRQSRLPRQAGAALPNPVPARSHVEGGTVGPELVEVDEIEPEQRRALASARR